MYDYRKMSPEQQEHVVGVRKARGYPWHSPPHRGREAAYRLVSAACYEHRPILQHPERLAWFAEELLTTLGDAEIPCAAWCVLPNHYHVLVLLSDVPAFASTLGRLHGRTSRRMNLEDACTGRKVWHRCQDRYMRSERHFYTTLNYVHHNPVRHGWVAKWQDWPSSSAHWYLEHKGRAWVLEQWQKYPLKDYGKKWDVFPGPGGRFVVPPSGGPGQDESRGEEEPPEGGTTNLRIPRREGSA